MLNHKYSDAGGWSPLHWHCLWQSEWVSNYLDRTIESCWGAIYC